MKGCQPIVFLVGISLFQACAIIPDPGHSTEKTPGLADENLESIGDIIERLDRAENTGDLKSLLTLQTDDVIWMPENEPAVIGKKALGEWYNVHDYSLEISHHTRDVHVSGDLAFNWGIATGNLTRKKDGKITPINNKYIQILRRSADDTWKISHVIWNSN